MGAGTTRSDSARHHLELNRNVWTQVPGTDVDVRTIHLRHGGHLNGGWPAVPGIGMFASPAVGRSGLNIGSGLFRRCAVRVAVMAGAIATTWGCGDGRPAAIRFAAGLHRAAGPAPWPDAKAWV